MSMHEAGDPKQQSAQVPEAADNDEEALRQSKALLDEILEYMDQGISVIE